mmetsp:Transcript_86211/g.222039  ORF Transcript_86211/g.222039 Transcript_86211/m.222039 type:complete len:261 (-) Transcript_86211:208-990(-)
MQQLHCQEELRFRLKPFVEPYDSPMVEAGENLGLATQRQVRLTLVLEVQELVLVDDLHSEFLTSFHVDTKPDLTEVAAPQERAHVPVLLYPLLSHVAPPVIAGHGRSRGGRLTRAHGRCHRSCWLHGFGRLLARVAGVFSKPKDVHCKRLVLGVLRMHADRDGVSMLQRPGVAFLHPAFVAPASVGAKLLDKISEGLIAVDPNMRARRTLVLNDDAARWISANVNLLLVPSDFIHDARLSERDELGMHVCLLRTRHRRSP